MDKFSVIIYFMHWYHLLLGKSCSKIENTFAYILLTTDFSQQSSERKLFLNFP